MKAGEMAAKEEAPEKKEAEGPPQIDEKTDTASQPQDGSKEVEIVEVVKNKHIENVAPPFISQKKVWLDEDDTN